MRLRSLTKILFVALLLLLGNLFSLFLLTSPVIAQTKARIFYQDIYPVDLPRPEANELWKGLERAAQKFSPTCEVTFSHTDKFVPGVVNSYYDAINAIPMSTKIIMAGEKGYDAAVSGCYLDPGMNLIRSATSIPVTFPGESSMLIAMLLGKKFGIVTVLPTENPFIEEHVLQYGFSSRFVGVQVMKDYWGPLIKSLKGDPKEAIAHFDEAALELIAKGADVIIPACAYDGPALWLAGHYFVGNTKVPIVDPFTASLKLAEVLASIRKTTGIEASRSVTSIYRMAPPEEIKKVQEMFGLR